MRTRLGAILLRTFGTLVIPAFAVQLKSDRTCRVLRISKP